MFVHPNLYKQTTTGKTQIWFVEQNGGAYRTVSGQLRGKLVRSEWTLCTSKNIGRSNETSPEEQATIEIEAMYVKKQTQKQYKRSVSGIENKTFFEPMLAKPLEEKRITEWPVYLQPKLDGMRCIARKEGLFSRNGKPIVNCPHIEKELEHLFEENPSLILDGELYNHDLSDDFNTLISHIKRPKPTPTTIKEAAKVVEFHIYDVGSVVDGFAARNRFIQDLFSHDMFKMIIPVVTMECKNMAQIHYKHKMAFSMGYEGSIIRLNKPYENKRSYSLMKYKDFITQEFKLLRFEEGLGNWAGTAKSAWFQHPNGNEFGTGVKGTKEYCKGLLENEAKYKGADATVVFQELTPDGVPKFGVMHSIRDYE